MSEAGLTAPETADQERVLIEAAQRDPTRFAALYESHFARIYTYAVRRVRSRQEAEPEPEPPLERLEAQARLYQLVRELPGDQRRVIEMRFAEEKSIRDVAAELGRSEGAVKQLQLRAIRGLRERMGQGNG